MDGENSPVFKKIGTGCAQEGTYPWKRYLAHWFDKIFYDILFCVLWYFILHKYPLRTFYGIIFETLAVGLMFVFVEPLFLMFWVSTPGKALFGIRIFHKNGRKLTYGEGLKRAFKRMVIGQGLMIPVYNIFAAYRAYRKCASGERMPWDEDVMYVVPEKINNMRFITFASGLAVIGIIVYYRGIMPKNRGELTIEKLVENYNMAAEYTGRSGRMYENGEIRDDDSVLFEFYMDDGIIKSAGYERTGNEDELENSGYDFLLSHAFVGSDVGCLSIASYERFLEEVENTPLKNVSIKFNDFTAERTIERVNLEADEKFFKETFTIICRN